MICLGNGKKTDTNYRLQSWRICYRWRDGTTLMTTFSLQPDQRHNYTVQCVLAQKHPTRTVHATPERAWFCHRNNVYGSRVRLHAGLACQTVTANLTRFFFSPGVRCKNVVWCVFVRQNNSVCGELDFFLSRWTLSTRALSQCVCTFIYNIISFCGNVRRHATANYCTTPLHRPDYHPQITHCVSGCLKYIRTQPAVFIYNLCNRLFKLAPTQRTHSIF